MLTGAAQPATGAATLLAAPIRRPLLVLGNLSVALAVTCLQLVALIAAAVLRGIEFDADPDPRVIEFFRSLLADPDPERQAAARIALANTGLG